MRDNRFQSVGWFCLCAVVLSAGMVVPAFGGDSADVLTAAQRQWLNSRPSLRIGATVIPPQIIYDSKTQQLSGIAVDFIRDIESHLGYSFSLVYYDTWDAMMNAADAGEIDIIFAAQKTPVRETKFVFTEPYLFMQNIIIAEAGRKDISSMDDLKGKKAAVVKGSSLEEDLGRLHPQINLIPVSDELTGLLGVSFGREDAMVVEIARASYFIHDKKITNLRIAGDAKLPFSLGFACRKELAEIRDILNAGLAEISPSRRAALQDKWIPLPHGDSWRVLLVWFGIAALALGGAFAWNLTLRTQVRKHREELERRFAEREQMQQDLSRFESQFRLTIDACPLGVHIGTLKPDGNLYFTGYNPAADKILCIDHRDLVGKLVIEAFPNLKETYIPDLYAEICQTGRSWADDKVFYDDGRVRGYFEIRAFQIAPGQMAVMFAEISDKIKAQQALANSEAQLNSIFRASPAGLGRIVDRVFVHINDRLCQITGYAREELIGHNTRLIYASDEEYQRIGQVLYQMPAVNGTESFQSTLRRKDGSLLDVIITASLLDVSDLSKGVSFAVMDISDRVRMERALRGFIESVSSHTGQRMLDAFVSQLASFFGADIVLLGRTTGQEPEMIESLAFWMNGQLCDSITYALGGTPCEDMIRRSIYSRSRDVYKLFAGNAMLCDNQIEAYVGMPLRGAHQEPIGILCALFRRPLEQTQFYETILQVFANQAAMEIQRMDGERALAESKRQMSTLMSNLPGVAYRCKNESDWPFEFVNKGVQDLTGYADNEILSGMPNWNQLIVPEDRQKVWDDVQKAVAAQQSYHIEYRIVTRSGDIKWVWEQGCGIFNDAGDVVALEGLVLDITERKRAEEELRKLALVVQNSSELINLASMDGKMIFLNEAGARMLGIFPQDAARYSIMEVIPEYLQGLVQNEVLPALMEKGHWEGDLQYCNLQTNALTDVHAMCFTIKDPKTGATLFLANVSLDITARKQAEEAQARLVGILEGTNDLVSTATPDGHLTYMNQAGRALVGWGDDVDLSRYVIPDIHPEWAMKLTGDVGIPTAIEEGIWVGESALLRCDGKEIPVSQVIIAHKSPQGELLYLSTIMRDITERKQAEDARERLMKEIQAKNEELQSIVFISSHDLRSPLINIQGFSGELQKACRELTVLLGREPLKPDSQPHIRRLLDEDIPEALSFIGAGANKMDVLLKGLLNLSRVGSATIHSEPVDMERLLASVVKTVAYQTRESSVHLEVESLPACVGDAVLLNQVFTNLIDNSIKYRRSDCETHIAVSGQRIEGRVRYQVADNGIGISAEHTQKIFEIFHRLDPGGSVKGEGLGLTIVRRILDRLDGRISVQSVLGQGSCFVVELPAVQQKTKTV